MSSDSRAGARQPAAPGDLVYLRGEAWLVSGTERCGGCSVLTLEGRDRHNAGHRWRAIEPFDRPRVCPAGRPRRRRRRHVLRAALAAIANARPAGACWTAAAAAIDLHAYQLAPALAVLRGAMRVLLADGVGLGKTVQAGLILSELIARGLVDRALVLTPAGLRATWASEFRARFDLAPVIIDSEAAAAAVPELPAGVTPWAAGGIVIASIDLVKRPDVLAAVVQAPFDLLIADEAHHLTPGSERGAAVDRLAQQIPWVVLASATPHSGDEAAFDYLTRLGALDDPIAIFRRTRRDAAPGPGRRTHLLPISPTPAERRLFEDVASYTHAIWHGLGQHDAGLRLLSIVLARRAASSAVALEKTLVRRLHLLAGGADPDPLQPALPWEDAAPEDGGVAVDILRLPGLSSRHDESARVERLIRAAAAARREASKVRRINRLLQVIREPAVVFTEFRDTLETVAASLSAGRRVSTLHGGQPAETRDAVVAAFNSGAVDVLVATDTAGEGLNLHHRCRLVIDVELPWNPLRLEQRIGRVDRIGQTRRVHAVSLVHRGTVEDTVLAHLERRRRRAGLALDAGVEPIGEADVARSAFDGVEPAARPSTMAAGDASDEAHAELARLTRQRALGAGVRRHSMRRPVWCARGHTGGDADTVALFAVEHRWATGATAASQTRALRVGGPVPPGTWAPHIRRLAGDVRVLAALDQDEDAGRGSAGLRTGLGERLRRIRSRIRAAGRPSGQPSLFDGRHESLAAARAQVAIRLDSALARRAEACDTPPAFDRRPRLIALWPWRA